MILICQRTQSPSPNPISIPDDLKRKGTFKTLSCICDVALGIGDRKLTGYQCNCLEQSRHLASAAWSKVLQPYEVGLGLG